MIVGVTAIVAAALLAPTWDSPTASAAPQPARVTITTVPPTPPAPLAAAPDPTAPAAGQAQLSHSILTHTATTFGPTIVGGSAASQPYPFEATLWQDLDDGTGSHAWPVAGAKWRGQTWFATNAQCVTLSSSPPSWTCRS